MAYEHAHTCAYTHAQFDNATTSAQVARQNQRDGKDTLSAFGSVSESVSRDRKYARQPELRVTMTMCRTYQLCQRAARPDRSGHIMPALLRTIQVASLPVGTRSRYESEGREGGGRETGRARPLLISHADINTLDTRNSANQRTEAISSRVLIGCVISLSAAKTFSTARSIPLFRSIGFIPAATALIPSL